MWRSERYLVIAAGLLLVVGVVSLARLDPVPPTSQSTPPASQKPEAPAPAAVLPTVTAVATAPPVIEPWSKEEALSTVATRFRDAKDLRAFYDRALGAGGPAHLWFAERALSKCQGVAYRGRVAAEQDFNSAPFKEQNAERQAAYRAWIEPCAGFETRPVSFGVEMQRVVNLMRRAPGPVGDRWRPHESADEEIVRNAITSGDPELPAVAIDLAARLGVPDPSATTGDESIYVKRYFSETQSWELALCELGRDCGKGSQTWFHACISSGDCAEGNYRQGYAGTVTQITKDDVPGILKRRDAIVAAIRARDWAALGLAP